MSKDRRLTVRPILPTPEPARDPGVPYELIDLAALFGALDIPVINIMCDVPDPREQPRPARGVNTAKPVKARVVATRPLKDL